MVGDGLYVIGWRYNSIGFFNNYLLSNDHCIICNDHCIVYNDECILGNYHCIVRNCPSPNLGIFKNLKLPKIQAKLE